MKDPIFSMGYIRNRAGVELTIIQKQDRYQVYVRDSIVSICHTLDKAILFARRYGTDSRHNG